MYDVTELRNAEYPITKHLDAAGNPHIRLSFLCYNMAEEVAQFAAILDNWQG